MTRKQDWELALHNIIEDRKAQAFSWGQNDCCLFVADAIEAVTGTDPSPEYRGKYSDQATAMAMIKSVTGGTTAEDAAAQAAATHGMKELPSALFAQRGDMVVFDGDEGVAVGIVHLSGRHALFVTRHGLRRIPLRDCRRAWRVG